MTFIIIIIIILTIDIIITFVDSRFFVINSTCVKSLEFIIYYQNGVFTSIHK